jgi:ribosomal protein S18 acetylase RimI-like enzyme
MIPVQSPEEIYGAIALIKADASDFRTNFYPTPGKLAGWVAQKQLWMAVGREAAFFLRQECDFWHLYFCAADQDGLGRGLDDLPELRTQKIISDVIGGDDSLLATMEAAGLRRYKRLFRMTRAAQQERPVVPDDPWREQLFFARESDGEAVRGLIESAFDRYAKQIPPAQEIHAAIEAHHVFVLKLGTEIAGLLHFDLHGATSTLRFWTVARRFRDRHVGGALMRHYLASQCDVRRFVLWVDEGNDNAISKYRRYHYDHDGVSDHILANECIPA